MPQPVERAPASVSAPPATPLHSVRIRPDPARRSSTMPRTKLPAEFNRKATAKSIGPLSSRPRRFYPLRFKFGFDGLEQRVRSIRRLGNALVNHDERYPSGTRRSDAAASVTMHGNVRAVAAMRALAVSRVSAFAAIEPSPYEACSSSRWSPSRRGGMRFDRAMAPLIVSLALYDAGGLLSLIAIRRRIGERHLHRHLDLHHR